MTPRGLQTFDEYRYGPRSVLVPGDRLRDWGQQVEKTGRWSAPPSLPDRRCKAVWKAHYEKLQL